MQISLKTVAGFPARTRSSWKCPTAAFAVRSGIDLTQFCRLDSMVTVVDAYRFWSDFASGETLMDRKQEVGEDDTREVVDLLIDQIEFCDVLILNKCDRVGEKEMAKESHVPETEEYGISSFGRSCQRNGMVSDA